MNEKFEVLRAELSEIVGPAVDLAHQAYDEIDTEPFPDLSIVVDFLEQAQSELKNIIPPIKKLMKDIEALKL